jgi:hypothetical protein
MNYQLEIFVEDEHEGFYIFSLFTWHADFSGYGSHGGCTRGRA